MVSQRDASAALANVGSAKQPAGTAPGGPWVGSRQARTSWGGMQCTGVDLVALLACGPAQVARHRSLALACCPAGIRSRHPPTCTGAVYPGPVRSMGRHRNGHSSQTPLSLLPCLVPRFPRSFDSLHTTPLVPHITGSSPTPSSLHCETTVFFMTCPTSCDAPSSSTSPILPLCAWQACAVAAPASAAQLVAT